MNTDRIKQKFEDIRREGRPGLIVFLTVGVPDLEATMELVPALVEAGADGIELGVPFSDPLGDGPVIQESNFKALQRGVSLVDCFETVEKLRGKVPDTPLVFMGYYNSIYNYGLDGFGEEARRVGLDGVIAIDLPHDEVKPLALECEPRGVHIIPLLAPTSTEESVKAACADATGFIYCVSLTGVTGARDQVASGGLDLVDRARAGTTVPLAVGFGISKREHVVDVCRKADAAVVGSALVRVMLESPRGQLIKRASRLVAELAGKPVS
ncbi:MAG: tryptophan synthase subunit alpha [SAR202 cluster bacterium Io17-Chloro-G2]|nr:MAG: tryptophan synthase subunit alpha [SAR202 cluster bacterium Io17-Chloro-G2]